MLNDSASCTAQIQLRLSKRRSMLYSADSQSTTKEPIPTRAYKELSRIDWASIPDFQSGAMIRIMSTEYYMVG